MSLLFQQILATVLVASAIGYIVVHYFRKKKSKSGCASCKALGAVQKKSSDSHPSTPLRVT